MVKPKKHLIALILSAMLLFSGTANSKQAEISDYDPMLDYKIGMSWEFPPYLLVDVPAIPGDTLYSQGPLPHIAPIVRKSGWLPGHAALYVGKADNNNDGIEEFVTAEAARYGVWYAYFYPMYRFEKGHGRIDHYLDGDTKFAQLLKKTFGDDLSESDLVKKYDDSLDGTYMGARTISLLENTPDEYTYRRKILEYSHNYVLQNSDYSYESFTKPIAALFKTFSTNTQGAGNVGKGHNNKFTCVGLVEASYEYAGIDLVPGYSEETNIGLTPLKQFLYMKPVSIVYVKKGDNVQFDAWHVVSSKRNLDYGVNCVNMPAGCTFDGRTFKINSSAMNAGTYEVEFKSAAFSDQHQKIKIIVSNTSWRPNFDYKDAAKDYKGIESVSKEIEELVKNINAAEADDNKMEHDQKLLAVLSQCKNVDDVMAAAKNIKNGSARDVALLYGAGLADKISDLYKLTMLTDSLNTTNKILFSPVGYKIQGIEQAVNKLKSADGFSLFYNNKCSSELKKLLKTDYIFSKSVNLPFKLSYDDISKLDSKKIMEFINYLCANPKELNILENSYIIGLLQKRLYFGIANGEKAAGSLRDSIVSLYKANNASLSIDDNNDKLNIDNEKLNVARFLYSMTKAVDPESGWLDNALKAEKTFLSASNIALSGVPGTGNSFNSIFSSSSNSTFNFSIIKGNISDALKGFIGKEEGTAYVETGSVSRESQNLEGDSINGSSGISNNTQSSLQKNQSEISLGENASAEVKEAYDRYKISYNAYIEALNRGESPDRLETLMRTFQANLEEYKKISLSGK